MVRSVAVWVCACVFWTVAADFLDLYEGDDCQLPGPEKGTCKVSRDCPLAQEEFNNGRIPQICNFKGEDTIVCCRPAVFNRQADIGSKSKMMCKTYAADLHNKIQEQTTGGGKINYDRCALKKPCGERESNNDKCTPIQPLIVNGNNAQAGEFPHMALIGYGDDKRSPEWLCGGSLISERFVLSAAHCTDAYKKGVARWVRLGDYDIQSRTDDDHGMAQTVEYEIIERINHPDYKHPSLYHDIALYKLNTNVNFNEYVRPLCLQTDHQIPNTYAIATGWGRTEYGGRTSDTLQKVSLTLTPREECSQHYNSIYEELTDGIRNATMFCAGDTLNGKDTCQGDSGGPLQVPLKDPYCMYSQIGVTSFGTRCGINKPGVYTRVSHYVPWIESVVWP